MSRYRIILLITLFSFFGHLNLIAQEITKSEVIQRVEGKEYYIHTVEQGQTLYSLSKVYVVTVDELVFENPDARQGLSIDQELRIPLVSRDRVINDELRSGEFRYIFHIVKKGETLFGISRIYDVKVGDLKNANPGWEEGLKPGKYLKVPMKARAEVVTVEAVQPVQEEPQEEKKYLEHTVKQKETLYGIARSYRISIDSLTTFNPGLTENIYPGEVIRIPLLINQDEYITHKVREKTKLKKIASKYAVSVTDMKEANPGIRSKVYPGDLVFIPVGPPADIPPEDVHVVEPPPDDIPPGIVKKDSIRCFEKMYSHQKEYKVALMIPLYAEEARNIELREKRNALNPDKYKSFNFIQFYEGFLLAVEKLEREGFRVKVYVYDVDEKVSKTIQVLQDPVLSEMDLIIGPFFSRNFKLVSNFAEMFDIKIVNPLTRRTEVLSHDNVYKCKPDRSTQADMLPAYVNTYHPQANIILVRNNKFEYADEIVNIREMLDRVLPYGIKVSNSAIYDIIEEYSEADTNLAPGVLMDQLMIEHRQILTAEIEQSLPDSTFFTNGIAEVVYASDSVYGIINNASLVRRNLVIVLSNNEIHVPEILTSLNDLKDTFDISVIGMPEWGLLENLETDYLLDLDVHFFSDSYYDHDDPEINNFILEFRDRFKTHPNNYAFDGYDLGAFFLGAMHRFGTDCEKCLPYYYADVLKGKIRFAPAKPSGYENKLWNFCRYRNYKIEKIQLH